ncbi:MAG TPA: hypothetical protein PKV86_01520 [Syntrophobacteraceae bacterium]|jgi:hypothetical protein|nr:hypothetical protein [Syntrophobacteraceae bacterium]
MMWLRRLLWGTREEEGPKEEKQAENNPSEPSINQGIFYLYLIIGLQVAFVFGLVLAIMMVGSVLATPLWVFLFAFALGIAGCVYVYRKAKRQFRKLRESLQKVDLSDRDYEISLMGGFLTMRVEHNPRRLIEAPKDPPIIESEPLETRPLQ